MAVIRILQAQMITAETYDRVNAAMGVDDTPPEGLLMHCAGELDGALQIVDVWESSAHAERFDSERLGPAIAEVVGMGPPGPSPTTMYELHNLVQP